MICYGRVYSHEDFPIVPIFFLLSEKEITHVENAAYVYWQLKTNQEITVLY